MSMLTRSTSLVPLLPRSRVVSHFVVLFNFKLVLQFCGLLSIRLAAVAETFHRPSLASIKAVIRWLWSRLMKDCIVGFEQGPLGNGSGNASEQMV